MIILSLCGVLLGICDFTYRQDTTNWDYVDLVVADYPDRPLRLNNSLTTNSHWLALKMATV